MNLNLTSGTGPSQNLKMLERKLTAIATELAIGEKNHEMGTLLGGNVEQYTMLLASTHTLVTVPTEQPIVLSQRYGCPMIQWNEKFLTTARLKDVREILNTLDFVGTKQAILAEKECSNGPAFLVMQLGLDAFVEKMQSIKIHADEIDSLLELKTKSISSSLPLLHFAIFAAVAQHLSREINQEELIDQDRAHWDPHQSQTMQAFVALAKDIAPEILLLVTRRYIGLETIVREGLDEYPVLDSRLRSVAALIRDETETID